MITRRIFRRAAAMSMGVLASSMIGCSPAAVEPLPLDIQVAATPTSAAPDDVIAFVVTVQGQDLLGVSADYGDGTTEEQSAGGARTGKLTFRHAFRARGTYTAKLTAFDASGQKSTAVTIRIL